MTLTEAQLQEQIVDLARLMGWRTMHVRRTVGRGRRWTTGTSVTGWPDLTLWRPGKLLMVEVKTDDGQLRPDQATVLDSLRTAGVDARCWRPAMWDEIEATLTAHRVVP
jgi:hypothetical protein